MWYNHIYLSTYIASIACIFGAIFFRNLQIFAKLIWVLILANVIVDLYATYQVKALRVQTHTLYNIFIVFEFLYILLIISKIYTENKKKHTIYAIGLFFIFFSIANLIFIQKTTIFNTYSFAIGGLLVIGVSYVNIRHIIMNNQINTDNIILWFSIANIIFYSAATPVLMLSPVVTTISENLADDLFKAKDGAYITWSILIATGFLCQRKKTI